MTALWQTWWLIALDMFLDPFGLNTPRRAKRGEDEEE